MTSLPFISVITLGTASPALLEALEAQAYPAYRFERLEIAPEGLSSKQFSKAQGTIWVFLPAAATPAPDFLEAVAEAFDAPERQAWVGTGAPVVFAARRNALPQGWEAVCHGSAASLTALALELATRPGAFCDAELEARRGAPEAPPALAEHSYRAAADAALLQARYGLAAPGLRKPLLTTLGASALIGLGLSPLAGAPSSFLWAWAGLFVWHASRLKAALVRAGRPLPLKAQLGLLLAGTLDGPLVLAGHAAGLKRARRKPEAPEDLLESMV